MDSSTLISAFHFILGLFHHPRFPRRSPPLRQVVRLAKTMDHIPLCGIQHLLGPGNSVSSRRYRGYRPHHDPSPTHARCTTPRVEFLAFPLRLASPRELVPKQVLLHLDDRLLCGSCRTAHSRACYARRSRKGYSAPTSSQPAPPTHLDLYPVRSLDILCRLDWRLVDHVGISSGLVEIPRVHQPHQVSGR